MAEVEEWKRRLENAGIEVVGVVGLVLRRQALIGDAISHVALPGIVVGFLIAGTVTTWPLMLGAMGAAVIAAVHVGGDTGSRQTLSQPGSGQRFA